MQPTTLVFSAKPPVVYLISLVTLSFFSCIKSNESNTLFSRLSEKETGLVFNNVNVENENINILTYEYLYNGGGVAIGDVNNDGLPDIYFSSNNLENKLFLNKGNFKFEDITATAGVGAKKGWKTGVSMADVNADGLLDIYVCRSADGNPENRRNLLFINNGADSKGSVTFSEKAAEYGVDDPGYSTQAVFFDMDNDGDLDLFVLNHSLINISNKIGISPIARNRREQNLSNNLYRNDNGKFTDISEQAGIFGGISNYGLGVMAADFNADGWTDIYVTNDYAENDHLYQNNRNGSFSDVINSATGHVPNFSMGTDAADINRDGLSDFFAGDMLPEDNKRQKLLYGPHEWDKFQIMLQNELHYQYMRNMLQLNNGDGTYSEIGQFADISNTDWSWATLLADYDNDGWNDLFVTNGYKRDFTNNDFLKYRGDVEARISQGGGHEVSMLDAIKKMPSNKVHNYIFRNKGDLSFENMSEKWGFAQPVLSNGAAYADLDNDGDLDLVVNNMDEQAGIYRNNLEKFSPDNKSVKFVLKGEAPNTRGIGARVRLYRGAFTDERELQPVRGFQSGVDFTLHFGLGGNAAIDSAVVVWHSGKYQRLSGIAAGQTVELRESDASGRWNYSPPKREGYFAPAKAPFDFVHIEDVFNDYNLQSTLPYFQSQQGPRAAVGDVNGDHLDDFFLTGAKGQASRLWLQSAGGGFRPALAAVFEQYGGHEDVDAQFADFDRDGDLDIAVVSGGYCFDEGSPLYAPRIYRNDGAGHFSEMSGALPPLSVNASTVCTADVDKDGDTDIFIGGESRPKNYPECAGSALLLNDGSGRFTDATTHFLPDGGKLGMIADALWHDIDADGFPDLVAAGAYTPIRFLMNEKGSKLTDKSAELLPYPSEGWWNRLEAADIDGDGDTDFVAGNWGMNNQMKVDETRPAVLVYKDFDGNGTIDPIPGYTIEGKLCPGLSLDELAFQLPILKKRFLTYESYASIDLEGLLAGDFGRGATRLPLRRFATSILLNNGKGHFTFGQLPAEAQFSPVYAIAVSDFNGDGKTDMLLGGNQSTARVTIGKMDANYGLLLLGDGAGHFSAVPQYHNGLSLRGDVRDFVLTGRRMLVLRNNGPALWYALQD
jgi:hypothetical protein